MFNVKNILFSLIAGMLLVSSISSLQASEISIHKNEETGLLTWTVVDQGFHIELIQLMPDFVRAIYAKHHFPKTEVERIAAYCVFGTILKNTSNSEMKYNVASWEYIAEDGVRYKVKTKSDWLEEWRKAGIKFSWTLLPDIGEFAVGDWQQGFTTLQPVTNTDSVNRKQAFDLIYRWQIDGKNYEGKLENLKCSPDTIDVED